MSFDSQSQPPIAYFCAEFGLDSKYPWYAGGLGVLAGDTLKQAVDNHVNLVGVGLMYRGDRSIQKINAQGEQEDEDFIFDPVAAGLEHVYLDNNPLFIKVHLTQIDVWCRCWKKTLSPEVTLYLLDTETDQNQMSERSITHVLYSGTEDSLLKQQLILGIGGVKLLHQLGIHPHLFHVQEGKPAFLHWQLVRLHMDEHGMTFDEAVQAAKNKTVYTNHTLVAAGNQTVSTYLLRVYGEYYAQKMGISIDRLLGQGIEHDPENFALTRFALNTSRKASGVSQLHTQLSQQTWPEYNWVNITNGVHLPTWQSSLIKKATTDQDLWSAHVQEKRNLADFIKNRTGFTYNSDWLVISWARRLAGYKRFDAIFSDVARLAAIIKQQDRPVQLLLSGKAHRLDSAGKRMLQDIISYLSNELSGSALYIPNFDLDVARMLVRGSDVWLNTPEYGKEASGTSGMKAISNGVLQCTVADGWSAEVNWQDLGWTLDSDRIGDSLYETLEQQIIPLYFQKNELGYSPAWLERMKKSIILAEQFSTERMLKEYQSKLYLV
jgi:starch phosphorylase